MRVTLEKMDGVESAEVSLNEGLARIRLRPGNRVRLEQIREAVRRNGFTPRDATVTVRARVVVVGDSVALRVETTNEQLAVEAAQGAGGAGAMAELQKRVGTTVIVLGTAPLPKDKEPDVVRVSEVRGG